MRVHFFPFAKNVISVLLIYYSFPCGGTVQSFLKDCTVFVGSFIMQKKVQVYSPVYLSCVRVFPSGP